MFIPRDYLLATIITVLLCVLSTVVIGKTRATVQYDVSPWLMVALAVVGLFVIVLNVVRLF